MSDPTAPALALPDLLEWIDDARARALQAMPGNDLRTRFAHEFMAAIIKAVPEVSPRAVIAHLEQRDEQGKWQPLLLTTWRLTAPEFEGHLLFHGGIATPHDLHEMIRALMAPTFQELQQENGGAGDRVRMGPLRVEEDPLAYQRIAGLQLDLVQAVLENHRARHLHARALDQATLPARSHATLPRI